MDIKLFDSELKVMDVLWKEGDTPAREIARVLTDELGWNVNTTYTLIKRCIKRGRLRVPSRALCAMHWFPSPLFKKPKLMN